MTRCRYDRNTKIGEIFEVLKEAGVQEQAVQARADRLLLPEGRQHQAGVSNFVLKSEGAPRPAPHNTPALAGKRVFCESAKSQ